MKAQVNPKSTSNQSSKPCTVLQYPSKKNCCSLLQTCRRRKCRALSHRNARLFDAKMSLLSVVVCYSLLQSSEYKALWRKDEPSFCCSLLQSVAVCCSHWNTRLFDANMILFPRKHTTSSYVSYLIFFQEKIYVSYSFSHVSYFFSFEKTYHSCAQIWEKPQSHNAPGPVILQLTSR